MSVWKTLSAIDCNKHVEKKGGFSYLAWTWAWAMVKDKYPLARYELLPDTTYHDGTMEVRVEVTIPYLHEIIENQPIPIAEHAISHTMWLPVLDFKNKAIPNPNAFEINSARMRCLTKCLCMFGLGHYIYAGESVPQIPAITDEQLEKFMSLVAEKKAIELFAYMSELGDEAAAEAFNSAPKGEKVKLKDTVRALQKEAVEILDGYEAQILEAVEAEDVGAYRQLMEEMDKAVRPMVWVRFTDIQQRQIKNLVERAA